MKKNAGIDPIEESAKKNEEEVRRMTQKPIPSLLIGLSIPTVLSMLISAIYNLADTYFVSHIGTAESAAVSVVFSLMSIIQAIGFGLGMGCGSLISRTLGKKDTESASRYASSAFAAAIFFGLLLILVGAPLIVPFMKLLGAKDDIVAPAVLYGKYIIFGAPTMCASFVMNNIMRAQGKAVFSMIGLGIGSILNIFLDPLFITTLGLGISGAAIATLVGQVVSFLILLIMFWSGKSIVRLSLSCVSRKLRDYWEVIHCGAPTIFRQGLASVSTACLNHVCGALPIAQIEREACVAAIGIANKLFLFARNIVIGIGHGFHPIAGFNYGAGKYDRVKKAFWFATALGTVICVIVALLFGFFSEAVMTAFIQDKNPEKVELVIKIGKTALRFIAMLLPFLPYATYGDQILQILGKSGRSLFLASCRGGIFFLPLIFTLPGFFGVTGVCLSQPLADLLTLFVTIPFQIIFFRQSLKTPKTEA